MARLINAVLYGIAASSIFVGAAAAQTQPRKDYGYFHWIKCTDGYGGALAWNGYPLDNPEQAARYPSTNLHNVHVHVLKAKAAVERDGKQAHEFAVKLCAAKIALYSRPGSNYELLLPSAKSEEVRKALSPTNTGHVIIFDDQDRIIGISDVWDMQKLGGFYAQYLISQRKPR